MGVATRRLLAPRFSPLSVPWHSSFFADDPAWLDRPVDAAAVASLRDASGNLRHALQATGAAQPLVRAHSSAMGDRGVVEFDGVDDRVVQAAYTAVGEPNEMFIVVRYRTVPAANARIVIGAASTHEIRANSTPNWQMNNGTTRSSTITVDTRAHVLYAVWDTTDLLFIDGDRQINNDAGANAPTFLSIGANSAGASPGAIDLGFLGFSDVLLADRIRQQLLAWARRYYLTPRP